MLRKRSMNTTSICGRWGNNRKPHSTVPGLPRIYVHERNDGNVSKKNAASKSIKWSAGNNVQRLTKLCTWACNDTRNKASRGHLDTSRNTSVWWPLTAFYLSGFQVSFEIPFICACGSSGCWTIGSKQVHAGSDAFPNRNSLSSHANASRISMPASSNLDHLARSVATTAGFVDVISTRILAQRPDVEVRSRAASRLLERTRTTSRAMTATGSGCLSKSPQILTLSRTGHRIRLSIFKT